MNDNIFSKKLIALRKKFNLTQQDLADKLNVTNKTISRWETAESYPDIDLLPKIANIFHVSIDYLLKEHDDFKEIDKLDIVSYIPWAISLFGVLIFYIFKVLSIPIIFNFMVYYFIIKFSYHFLKQYTDRKNGNTLVSLNTIANFFVSSTLAIQVFGFLYIVSLYGTFITPDISVNMNNISQIMFPYIIGYLVASIYAFIHYKGHKTEEYCNKQS